MTDVLVNLTRHTPTGRVPAAGVLRWTPTRRVHIDAPTDGPTDEVVVPAPFTVQVDGPTTVAVDPSGTSWAWTVHEATDGGRTIRTVAVPDSPTPIDYGDLADVDPATLAPAAEPVAAWWAAHDALAAQVAGLGAGTGGGLTVVDNLDGTLTIDGTTVIDNLDGTLTIGA